MRYAASVLTVEEFLNAPSSSLPPSHISTVFESLFQWMNLNPTDFVESSCIQRLENFLPQIPWDSLQSKLFRSIDNVQVWRMEHMMWFILLVCLFLFHFSFPSRHKEVRKHQCQKVPNLTAFHSHPNGKEFFHAKWLFKCVHSIPHSSPLWHRPMSSHMWKEKKAPLRTFGNVFGSMDELSMMHHL